MTLSDHEPISVPCLGGGSLLTADIDAVPAVPAAATQGPALTVIAHGIPQPQGSKRIGRGRAGKPILIDDNDNVLEPWRATIAWQVARVMRGRTPYTGALRAEAVFTLPRPKSAPTRAWPTVKPDGDKLLRACFDAVTQGRGWKDDALVVQSSFVKTYPGGHPYALSQPGVHLRIWQVQA